MVGGVLLIVSDFLELLLVGYDLGEAATTGAYAMVTGLTLLGTVLLLVGLVGLYVCQSEAAGLLGLVGFLMSFLGNVLVAGALWEATFVVPWLAWETPELLDEGPTERLALGFTLSYTLAGLGVILFGVATIRARVFPRVAAVLLIIGGSARRGVELRAAAPARRALRDGGSLVGPSSLQGRGRRSPASQAACEMNL
jgi:hypothetical protein